MTEATRSVTFIGINSSWSHTMLSGLLLKAWTRHHSPHWKWRLIEATLKSDFKKLLCEILQEEDDMICGTAYLFNREPLLALCREIASVRPELPLFLGGPEFHGDNRSFLTAFPFITGVIRGDESSTHLLPRSRTPSPDWKNIPGLCYRDGSVIHDGGTALALSRPTGLPSPYDGWIPPVRKPFLQLETVRGCSNHCTFCTHSRTPLHCPMPLDTVREELKTLQDLGVEEVRILDRTFNEDLDRASTLLDIIRAEFPGLRLHLEINPALFSSRWLEALRNFPPKNLHLEVGIQTLSAAAHRSTGRREEPEHALEGLVHLLSIKGLSVHVDLLAGLPFQTWPDVLTDTQTIITRGPAEIQLEVLKVLPGTALSRYRASPLQWESEPPYAVLSTATLSLDEIEKCRILSSLLDASYNSPALQRLIRFLLKVRPGALDELVLATRNEKILWHSDLPERFNALTRFAESWRDPLIQTCISFSYLTAGLSPKAFGITPGRCRTTRPQGTFLYRDEEDKMGVRFFEVLLPWNAGELLFGLTGTPVPAEHRYYFEIRRRASMACVLSLPACEDSRPQRSGELG